MILRIDKMNLSPLQRKRLIFLLGCRYKGSPKVKIVVRQYKTFEENYYRGLDIIKQLYWEALRAPIFKLTDLRPRKRRLLINKYLGRGETRKINILKGQESLKTINNLLEKSEKNEITKEEFYNKRIIHCLKSFTSENTERDRYEEELREEKLRKIVLNKKEYGKSQFENKLSKNAKRIAKDDNLIFNKSD